MSNIVTVQNDSELTVSPIQRVELDTQIATAKAYPRVAKTVLENAIGTATMNLDIAESCFYIVPRAGDTITGESIRLAEIIAGEWGNLHFGTRVLGHSNKEVTAEAVVWDLEKNNKVTIQETRRITNKDGKLYSADMIQTTGKAASSIALRNGIFKMVPRSFTLSIVMKIKEYITTAKNPEERIKKALASFASKKVPEAALLKILGKEKVSDLDANDLFQLIGLWNALKDNVITVDEILNPPKDEVDGETGEIKTKSQSIIDRVKAQDQK